MLLGAVLAAATAFGVVELGALRRRLHLALLTFVVVRILTRQLLRPGLRAAGVRRESA